MFRRVLVANRGEIAVRICRTLREMEIESVVTASIPDRASLAVRSADAWVLLEGHSAAESYLEQDAIIAAAKAQRCDAIHPGYGFLSENAAFAERCGAEGIVFIGPPPAVLRVFGDKAASRQLAAANGVPTVPGYDGPDDDATLAREAERIGFPLMVKARAGGGGRGMREVRSRDELPGALAGARREAESSFGDGGLLLERLVERAHHVEVQIFGDTHGNLIHLGERDCSVQRRRQKLIEESPSPVVDDALRAELTDAALRLARAAGYVNAGTVEFLVGAPGADGRRPFTFIEVNPRLQVEHPVTEAVTGLDLVEWQLRVATGEALPLTQAQVAFSGHAIELRINAEDPWEDFRPGTGRLTSVPGEHLASRVDPGYAAGDVVPPQYDSLVAKAVIHRPDRVRAISEAVDGMARHSLGGVRGNTRLLFAVLASAEFGRGACDAAWLEREFASLLIAGEAPWCHRAAAAAGAFLRANPARAGSGEVYLDDGARVVRVTIVATIGGVLTVTSDEREAKLRVHETGPGHARFQVEGSPGRWGADFGEWGAIRAWSEGQPATRETETHDFTIVPPPPLPRRARVAESGASLVTAPLAGTIAAVRVTEGATVATGDLLLTLEAMKMEHRVTAPSAGTVRRITIAPGAVVREGDVLVELA